MNEADALDIFRAAIWTVLVGAGPAVVAAAAIGLIIALIQALTQVQETTLTFAPKIVAVIIAVGVSAPLIGASVAMFARMVFAKITTGL